MRLLSIDIDRLTLLQRLSNAKNVHTEARAKASAVSELNYSGDNFQQADHRDKRKNCEDGDVWPAEHVAATGATADAAHA